MNIEKELTLHQVLDGIPLGIAVFDNAGNITVVNSCLAKLIGLTPQDVQGSSLKEMFLERGVSPDHPFLQCLGNGEYTGPVTPLTSSFPSYFSTHTLKDGDGESLGGVIILWDARRQQELEQAVLKAERLAIMGQLTAITLHEVRNPLSLVRGLLQLLKRDLHGSSEQQRVEMIMESLDRINSLITNYLRLAKPGVPKRQPCYLKELIGDVVSLIEAEFGSKGVSVFSSCFPDLPRVVLDQEQFHQVLINIMKNAAEITPTGGEIWITTDYDQENELVQILVRDSGPGISEEVLPRVFDPFFTTGEKGTGLGLYICREIVNNHGGQIQITNNPDQGCTVTITLSGCFL